MDAAYLDLQWASTIASTVLAIVGLGITLTSMPAHVDWFEDILHDIHLMRIRLENALLDPSSREPGNDELKKTIEQAKEAAEEVETWLKSERLLTLKTRLKWTRPQSQRQHKREQMARKLKDLETIEQSTEQSPILQSLPSGSRSIVAALANEIQEDQERVKPIQDIIAIGRLLEDYGQNTPQSQSEENFRREASEVVLQQLQYEVMRDRAETIKLATTRSCSWVWEKTLENGQHSFADWLVSGTGVYFIAGNEGSGKSTLMKFLFCQSQTFEHLSKWAAADSNPLATAAFFFWRNGTQLEKSEEGLLRSLLHSILSQQSHIIPSVLPGTYAKAYASVSSRRPGNSENGILRWEIGMLRKAFTRLIQQTQSPIKLFFLIDGIDEYQDNEIDRRAMINFLTKEIALSKNAKAVIASRHLSDMDRFDIKPSLTVHDLNHRAIHTYIKETLDEEFQGYAERLPDNISDRIASSANGSFLWASLTLANVSQLLAEGRSFDDADEVLKGTVLPSTIHELYDDMWRAIPTSEKRRASEIIEIVSVGTSGFPQPADDDIRLVDLMLALGHPHETVESGIIEWEERTIEQKCRNAAYPFISIWPGFLTVGRDDDLSPNARIQYCHRSVPEYFSRDVVQQSLKRAVGTQGFCPHLAHGKGAVQHLKILPQEVIQDARSLPLLWGLAARAMLSLKLAESSSEVGPQHKVICQELLQQLDRTMSHHRVQQQQKRSGQMTLQDPYGFFKFKDFGHEKKYLDSLSWVNFHPHHSHPRCDEDSFLSLCIRFGLKGYLEDPKNLDKKILRSKRGRPLLDYALYPAPIAPYDLISPEIVQLLLEHGASPNEDVEILYKDGKTTKVTCWEHALMWQHQTYKADKTMQIGGTIAQAKRTAEVRLEIMELLVKKGAKTRTKIVTSTGERLIAKDALKESFTGWVTEENLKRVLGLFDTGSAKQGIRGILKR